MGDVLGRSIAGPVGRCIGPSRLWILVLLCHDVGRFCLLRTCFEGIGLTICFPWPERNTQMENWSFDQWTNWECEGSCWQVKRHTIIPCKDNFNFNPQTARPAERGLASVCLRLFDILLGLFSIARFQWKVVWVQKTMRCGNLLVRRARTHEWRTNLHESMFSSKHPSQFRTQDWPSNSGLHSSVQRATLRTAIAFSREGYRLDLTHIRSSVSEFSQLNTSGFFECSMILWLDVHEKRRLDQPYLKSIKEGW